MTAAYKVAVVTISDTACTDHTLDRSGPALVDALNAVTGYEVVQRAVVPDDSATISSTITSLIDEVRVDLVITTGGTGFGRRDVTPESLSPLITRQTPALTHALTAHSLRQTPLAALSRAVTGIRRTENHDALIIALPGSPKAVRECLELLLQDGLLTHALELLRGGDGKAVHVQMQGCLHRHHAPKPRTTELRTVDAHAGPSLRLRESPYPIVPLNEAMDMIANEVPAAKHPITLPVSTALVGHVLAEDVSAPYDLPPGPTTNVDGYAVTASTTPPGEYTVITLPILQQRDSAALAHGEVLRVNTGQGIPTGTDAVVMVEDTLLTEEYEGQEVRIKILAQVDVGENVRARGSDVRADQTVLPIGTTISALGGELGTLAFLGRQSVSVYAKPRIALLSTGNELVDPIDTSQSTTPWGFRVYDANRPSLKAAISGLGYEVIDLGIVKDDADSTLAALQRGLASADMLITTGGTSMGESDLLKPLIERELHGQIHFGRVAMKPGKPTTFATINGDKTIFALPGNPASALVTFYLFVLPALRKLSGYSSYSLPRIRVKLADQMRLDSRPEFHRVVLKCDEAGQLIAHSTGSQRSSGMHSMASANALIALPVRSEGHDVVYKGEMADAILLGPIS